jgi:hypothetical protein
MKTLGESLEGRNYASVARIHGSRVTWCMGKGKVHYIEVLSMRKMKVRKSTFIAQMMDKHGREAPHLEISEQALLQEGTKKVTIATLSGVPGIIPSGSRELCRDKELCTN